MENYSGLTHSEILELVMRRIKYEQQEIKNHRSREQALIIFRMYLQNRYIDLETFMSEQSPFIKGVIKAEINIRLRTDEETKS